MKLSIRELLLVTMIAGLALGWWLDHRHLELRRVLSLRYAGRIYEGLLFAREDDAILRLELQEHGVTEPPNGFSTLKPFTALDAPRPPEMFADPYGRQR
jgi:hypothetical protein